MTQLYPWQIEQWQRLIHIHQQSRLPHALLFSGMAGIGKISFAHHFAKAILCQSLTPKNQPCQQCQSCHLFEAESHPDFLVLRSDPDAKIKTIKIAEIRNTNEWLLKTAQTNEYRFVMIENAEQMNIASSNALLKTLEEPIQNRFIILVSSASYQLSATIRSRCQQFNFSVQQKISLDWLQQTHEMSFERAYSLLSLAQGSPLQASYLIDSDLIEQRINAFKHFTGLIKGKVDPIIVASLWIKQQQVPYLDWLLGWLIDLVRLTYHQTTTLYHAELQKNLQLLIHNINFKQLYQLYDELLKAKLLWQTTINQQLLLEKILIQCTEINKGEK